MNTPKTTAKHTPGPWEVLPNSSVIFGVSDKERYNGKRVAVAQCGDEVAPRGGLKYGSERDANAAFIVQACNAHDDLVAALERVQKWFKNQPGTRLEDLPNDFIDAALAKANKEVQS